MGPVFRVFRMSPTKLGGKGLGFLLSGFYIIIVVVVLAFIITVAVAEVALYCFLGPSFVQSLLLLAGYAFFFLSRFFTKVSCASPAFRCAEHLYELHPEDDVAVPFYSLEPPTPGTRNLKSQTPQPTPLNTNQSL